MDINREALENGKRKRGRFTGLDGSIQQEESDGRKEFGRAESFDEAYEQPDEELAQERIRGGEGWTISLGATMAGNMICCVREDAEKGFQIWKGRG